MAAQGGRRLLIALAHPDDESFGMAGLIARYVAEGAEVYLICSTNGDVGTVEPHFMDGFNTVAERRLAELGCAAQTLGLTRVFTLGYRDSGMAGTPDNLHPESLHSAPLDKVTEEIVHIIREVRPQVVITFDPFGGYGHPDHIKMYQATTAAFEAASDPARYPNGREPYRPQKLYYHTFPRGFLKLAVQVMPLLGKDPARFGRNNDINLKEIADNSYPIHAVIRYDAYRGVAEQARLCHASQLGSGDGGNNLLMRIWDSLSPKGDTLMRAIPPVTKREPREKDVFSGIVTE